MSRKMKFALRMADGYEVRNDLETLREHFDIERAVDYFHSGQLAEWLEDRYYEDEAKAIEGINPEAPNLREEICHALGVGVGNAIGALDIAMRARLDEKRAILREMTDEEEIIALAPQTALNQEDLADLLDMNESVIYLCGERFRVPTREKGKRYIGILGTPKVDVKAESEAELNERKIFFENVRLPWGEAAISNHGAFGAKAWLVPKAQLKAMFAATFKDDFSYYEADSDATFLMTESRKKNSANGLGLLGDTDELMRVIRVQSGEIEDKGVGITLLSDDQKRAALSLVCGADYKENDLVHLRISDTMSRGWAFTRDSFCVMEGGISRAIPYVSLSDDVLKEDGVKFPGNGDFIRFSNMLCSDAIKSSSDIYVALGGSVRGHSTAMALKIYLNNLKSLFHGKS